MVRLDQVQDAQRRRREAEERNPLLKLSLGELVKEMQLIATKNPGVLEPREHLLNIPTDQWNLAEYKKYDAIMEELDRREKEYRSYKSEPKFG